MEIRNIPTEDKFMKGINPRGLKPSDILYSYLQTISYVQDRPDGKKVRFVYKKDINYTNIQNNFGLDEFQRYKFERKAVERAFKVLVSYGYVRKTKVLGLKLNYVDAYEFPYDGVSVPIYLDTLIPLVRCCNANMIKLYVFLRYKYDYYKNNKYVFTKKILLSECYGVSSFTNQKNYDDLNLSLKMLHKLGLIDYHEIGYIGDSGQATKKLILDIVNKKIVFEKEDI